MSEPMVSRLWIAAADRVVDQARVVFSNADADAIRMRVRAAAVEVEELMNTVAEGRRVECSRAVAALFGRFGGQAVDLDQVGAIAIASAVEAACADAGMPATSARRLADSCRAAVVAAGAALDAISLDTSLSSLPE